MKGPLGVWVGWGLALVAVVVGYLRWGWPGALMAVSVVVFWLLLQFSQALRVLRTAGQRPKGLVDNAVMFHSRLAQGLTMMQLVKVARSLGEPVGDQAELWRWHDAGGDRVQVQLRGGRVEHWELRRAQQPGAGEAAPPEGRP